MALQNLRSSTAHKRPTATSLADGQIAINTNAASPGIFFNNSSNVLTKVGPIHIGTSAPNSSPAGSSGNATGEQWLDTSGGAYALKIWDGSAWRQATVSGLTDANIDAAAAIAGTKIDPDFGSQTVETTGVFSAAGGAEATPSITFTGDLNTGIYSPGADQVAISTGGTGRLFVDASGDVGIHKSSPIASLDVETAADQDVLRLRNNNGNDTRLKFANQAAGLAEIWYQGDFRFVDDENSDTERLRIDSSGRVGIGTSSPDTSLEVEAPSSNTAPQSQNYPATQSGAMLTNTTQTDGVYTALSLRASNAGGTTQAAHIYAQSTNSGFSPELHFSQRTGSGTSQSRMMIDSSGRVGIGTSSPAQVLHVRAASNDIARFESTTTNGSATIELKPQSTSGLARIDVVDNACDFSISTVGNADALVIKDAGNVGIGTTSPGAKAEISQSTGGDPILRLRDSANVQTASFSIDSNLKIDLRGGSSSSAFSFTNDSTEVVRIDSSGRLLVGTSSSIAFNGVPAPLQIQGNTDATSRISIRRTADDASPGILVFGKSRSSAHALLGNGDTIGQIEFYGADGTDTNQRAGLIACQVDGAPGTNDMPGRLVFSTTADGASSPTERLRIDSSGRVGIGTSSPGSNLEVAGTGAPSILVRDTDGTNTLGSIGHNAGQTTFTSRNGTSNGTFIWYSHNGTVFTERLRIDASGNLGIGTSSPQQKLDVRGVLQIRESGITTLRLNDDTTNYWDIQNDSNLRFSRGGTERMRMDSSGRLMVGGGAADGQGVLTVKPNSSNGCVILNFDRASTTSNSFPLIFKNGGTTVGSIYFNNTGTGYNTSSDYRLKENVTPVTDGITRLQQLKPSRFNFIADPTKTVDGFLAHEVQDIVPEAITGEKDAVDEDGEAIYQGIDQSKLVPLLTAALQEAIAKIETLEQRLSDAGL